MYTKEEIIEKSRKIHGDRYDYSKVNYKNIKDKVIIICPEHGEFETTFDNHINGRSGCPECSKVKRYNNDEWIAKAKRIHGNKYDYSKVKYTNAREKVTIICHEKDILGIEHGEFDIRACNHITGTGCPKCGKRYKMSQNEFIGKAKLVHGDKYDYSETKYTYSTEKVDIICKIHGLFTQVASSHLMGCGCPKCNKGVRIDKDEFIEKSKEVHGDYYDYSDVDYISARTKVLINCPRHGAFLQTPAAHMKGCGCQKCKSSRLEDVVLNLLKKNDISFIYQSNILDMGKQSVDFLIPDKRLIIECQGEQHFNPVDFSKGENKEQARLLLKQRKKLDNDKQKKAVKMGFELIYFAVPAWFSKRNTNIWTKFYKEHKLFTDRDELLKYIVSKDSISGTDETNLYENLNKELGYIGTPTESALKIKDYFIKIIPLEHGFERAAQNIRNGTVKRNLKPILIFMDEYMNTREIVLSKIKSITHNEPKGKDKIYGRNIEIREISSETSSKFLKQNHVQGSVIASVYLGAYWNKTLIGVMCFTKNRKYNWELVRFATDINYICCGVWGKMFAYFKKNFRYNTIKSFADRRWTLDHTDNLYTKLGFEFDCFTRPDYAYYNPKVERYRRFHKFLFRKKILERKYGFPDSMTESQMVDKLGYERIWNCGLIRYVYRNEEYIEGKEEE